MTTPTETLRRACAVTHHENTSESNMIKPQIKERFALKRILKNAVLLKLR